MGKFFPDKAKVSAPLYYSVTKEELRPKYSPLDNDMELKEALDAIRTPNERDSLERIAVTKTTNTNFALSNVRVGIQTKRHPMPYDPANFSLSYSHSHRYTSGKTTVYEREDNWKGALSTVGHLYIGPWNSFEGFATDPNGWISCANSDSIGCLRTSRSTATLTAITMNYKSGIWKIPRARSSP